MTVAEWFKDRAKVMPESETKKMFRMAISALEKQEKVNTQSVNLTHTTYPNALESLNILESAKDENGCVPMSLVRQAFRNILEKDRWIPVTERLPEVNRDVLLSSNMGNVYAGHRDTTDFIYKVTDKNGRELWVYDPEAYTDDIDSLPKTEDCSFDNDECTQGWLSVSSANYNDRFEGITAWRPLPEPYTEEEV